MECASFWSPEEQPLGENSFWGAYGANKIAVEAALQRRVPEAYILRPPYLYGPMNNVYREAFVFDCAMTDREFYLPGDGEMGLQFFHVADLCRFMDILMKEQPEQKIFNVGNPQSVSVREWVELCYDTARAACTMVPVHKDIEQRNYFSFYDYDYRLDVSKQSALMPETKPLAEGLAEACAWYRENRDSVNRKNYMEYIDEHLR